MTTSRIGWAVLAALYVSNAAYADVAAPVAGQAIVGLPVTGAPIQRPHTRSCTVNIVKNFSFDAFGKISEQAYAPPKDCPGPWALVVLDMDGAIDGVQYDRFGFIHLGQAELLRFTTPEPPHHAIHWHVEKDVTAYSSLFAAANAQNFTVQLDNSISEKLNGVYRLNATLTFYLPDKKFPAAAQPNLIKSIASGDTKQPYFSVVSPTAMEAASTLELPTNITHAILEVYATPHDLEEFWYLPGGNIAPYRELQIYIDGKLAGIAWPFPYIYTGGFNPHYWTPITAIDALNIPPYIVDLTPFAAMLNKPGSAGNQHRFSIKLNVTPSNWLIDANLLLETDPKLERVTGQVTDYHFSPTATVTDLKNPAALKIYKNKKITRSLLCAGKLTTSQGDVTTTLEQTFSLTNEFPALRDKSHVFDHLLSQEVATKVTTKRGLETTAKSLQTSYTFRISPSVDTMNSDLPAPFAMNQSLQRVTKSSHNGVLEIDSVLSQRIRSANQATLTAAHEKKNSYFSNATSTFQDRNGKCYYLQLQAAQNTLTQQTIQDDPNGNLTVDLKASFNACH
jgi:hypothetical protein